ncbi:RagB/SusD family nutrient uptake outer membrane protein [Labilibaculum sp. DW002]|uniref:RagB/SusD family nutrient uptake outer membrane protein n=1 Tax=Paralabilibaculum antarcticum TaxID=2912572 RepID=A0ABT5VQ17_9BACT|nr:RagB/SusD family nutrient uptake outer membrane protein [Labilibaculum sp. DW002]MDE5417535.1 RagB/SusD family nutrient uptake outer membrane protein [Labilibaculum sp. DW002]
MKKYIYKCLVGLMMLFSLSSCDDYLTEVNPNEVTTGSFWKTLNDCEIGLVGTYNQFSDGNIMLLSDETNRSDLSFPGYGRPSPPTPNPAYLQIFNSGYNGVNKKWDALYKGIFRANQVIEGLEGIKSGMDTTEEDEQWKRIMAQARFFRGLFHFYLHNSYNKGSVIIYDFVPKSEEDFYQTLSSAEDVKAFYTADLEYALEHLPATLSGYAADGNTNLKNFKGRIIKGAAAAVLGKSYLYAGDYSTAAVYFKAIIDSGVYALADVSENSTTNGEFNSESILEVSYDANYKPEYDQYSPFGTTNNNANLIAAPQTGGWRGIYPSCWLIMTYRQDSIDINDPRNLVTEEDGSTRYRKFSLRTSHSIAVADDEDLLYYQRRPSVVSYFNNGETAYWRKNTNWDITDHEKNLAPPGRSGINYRVIRLADVYLMYAECLIEGGSNEAGVTEALMYINRVRQRAALQLLGATPAPEFAAADYDKKSYMSTDVMNHLMYVERPLELSAEGHAIRHLDLRRWGLKKQRLDELAAKTFYIGNYKTVDEKGKDISRDILFDVKSDAEATLDDPVKYPPKELFGFQQSAINYIENLHSYWPIPNSETTANPNVN